jgi:hypothetical protein
MRVSSSPAGLVAAPQAAELGINSQPGLAGRSRCGFTAVFSTVLGDPPAPTAAAASRDSPVVSTLARLSDSQRSVDQLLAAAASGRRFTPAQLLALQAAVCRDAQTVEVVSRTTDRILGAVKQVLNAQI